MPILHTKGFTMFTGKTIILLVISTSFFCLSGCSSSKAPESRGGYYYSGLYFGKNLPETFQRGIRDGCTTAKGDYKKSHIRFNYDEDYQDGWFLGRNRCRHLLVIEDDTKVEEWS